MIPGMNKIETIRIDASTICQLRCDGCGFQRNNHRALGGGYLTFQNFKKLVDEIPIKFSLDWDKNYKPTHIDFLKRETGLTSLTRGAFEEEKKESWNGDVQCNNLILAPQINWDGRLLGCCCYSTGDYGVNVFEVGLKKALRSKLYVKSKKCLLKVHPREDVYGDSPCYNCNSRLVREKNGRCLRLKME